METVFDEKHDSTDYISIMRSKSYLIDQGISAAKNYASPKNPDRIIIMGMGGSGMGGKLLRTYLDTPIEIIQDYKLIGKITSKSLVFVCSYSGETEEALSLFSEVSVSTAKLFVVTAGGTLKKSAQSKNIPIILLNQNIAPRSAAISMFFAVMQVLINGNTIPSQDEAIQSLKEYFNNNEAMNAIEEYAKSLSLKIEGNVPLIYTTQRLESVGYCWKAQMNENAGTHCFLSVLPELCHNELNAYMKPGDYYVIFLVDEQDTKRMKERVDALRNTLNDNGVKNSMILVKGQTVLVKIMSTFHLGELISYYLSLRYGKDPMNTDIIEAFKAELGKKKY
ncbi:MAG: SIS domain-containing protein [Candidatus Woesearchaeota archaeon]